MDIPNDMIFIGNRGCGRTSESGIVENTFYSFNKLRKTGIQWGKADIQVTLDEQPIIFHDFTLQDQPIHSYDLKSLTVAFFAYTGMNLCALVDLLHQDKLNFIFELRYPTDADKEKYNLKGVPTIENYLGAIFEVFNSVKINDDQKIILSSYEPKVLEKLHEMSNDLKRPVEIFFQLGDNTQGDSRTTDIKEALNFVKEKNFKGIILDEELVNQYNIWMFKHQGLEVYSYGGNIMNIQHGLKGCILDDCLWPES